MKKGKQAPESFVLEQHDPNTGKSFGWVPASVSSFFKLLTEAIEGQEFTAGSYELCGPKVNGNPERLEAHQLFLHGAEEVSGVGEISHEALKSFLENFPHEGIVWHAADGRMAKIKRRDFWS